MLSKRFEVKKKVTFYVFHVYVIYFMFISRLYHCISYYINYYFTIQNPSVIITIKILFKKKKKEKVKNKEKKKIECEMKETILCLSYF